MTSVFVKNGNKFYPTDQKNLDVYDLLPVGTYTIKLDEQSGQFYVEQISDFTISGKIYGNLTRNTTRIINTFLTRPGSTGVMLAGEKGSGKTMLMKNLVIECAKKNIPTLVINAPWRGDKFNTFIQSINQPCVICWDEFEKVYDRDKQTEVLTLLDGVFPSRKLFVLTCNDKYRVDTHMRNRPGRIYYMLDFEGLESSFVREYCEDNLVNRDYLEKVVTISGVFTQFNFDMLKALIEEMNRYDETPQQALEMLNIKPEFSDTKKYSVKLRVEGKVIKVCGDQCWTGNPLNNEGVDIGYYETDEDGDEQYMDYHFPPGDLKQVLPKEGKFVFSDEAAELILERETTFKFDYNAF